MPKLRVHASTHVTIGDSGMLVHSLPSSSLAPGLLSDPRVPRRAPGARAWAVSAVPTALRLCTAGLPLPRGRPLRRGGDVPSHSSLLGALSVSFDKASRSASSSTDDIGLSAASVAGCSACPVPNDAASGASAPAPAPLLGLRSLLVCGAAAAAAATAAASPGAMPGRWTVGLLVGSLLAKPVRSSRAATGYACLRRR